MHLAAAIAAAYERRAALHADPTLDSYRLFHGWDEGCPGVEIDRYGDTALIEVKTTAEPLVAELAAAVDRCRAFQRVVVRARPGVTRAHRGDLPSGRVPVHEHGLTYLVELGRAGNPGLFLDARPARAWIRANSAGRRVMNLFAFAGSLGVAAAAGGARSVLHVDTSQAALDWCRANHEINSLPVDDRSLARMNIYQHLRKGAASRQRFDAIIVDPPPGPDDPRPSDRSPGQRGPVALVPQLCRMLELGGWLLAFFHHGVGDEAAVCAAAGVPLEVTWQGHSGDDFPERDPRRKLRLAVFTRRA